MNATRPVDEWYMAEALRLAELGRGRTSPNPMVGAVIVSTAGAIVGAGCHERAGLPHAEVVALDAAGGLARGATLYCTLEPCCHTGRTGPCVERIVAAGIQRVAIGVEDPNPLVNGGGIRFLREHGVEVVINVRRRESTRLNEAFFTYVKRRRPFVTVKIATSLDGKIAARPGEGTRLTSDLATQHVHRARAEVDAIGVGSQTLLVDDPLLTARHVSRTRPLVRVIFDRRLRTPPVARIFSTLGAGPIIIVTDECHMAARAHRADALARAGAELLAVGGDLAEAVRRLAERSITTLLLEGGRVLHEAALRARVVDRVHLYIAPAVLGPPAVPWVGDPRWSVASLQDLRVDVYGPDVFIEGYVHRID